MKIDESLYARLGGEEVLRTFVDALYDFMDSEAEVEHVRSMHSAGLSHANNRLFMFLSGMLGGPALYMEAFGHPRLRQKHMHFEIGNKERDQWLMCAQYAADQLDIEGHLRSELMVAITVMANHLRNKDVSNGGPGGQQCLDVEAVS